MKYTKLRAQDLIESIPPVGQRPEGAQHWSKSYITTNAPGSHQLVGAAYESALILRAMPSRFRGAICVFASGLLCLAVLGFSMALPLGIKGMMLDTENSGVDFLFFAIGLINLVIFVSSSIFLIAALRFLRLDLFSPKEIPLVFNRATRKVYRFSPDMPSFALYGWSRQGVWLTLRQIPPYVMSTFAPLSMLLVEYDWDCLEAEYRTETVLSNNVMRTVHHIDLLVREAPGSDTLIGSFPLAPAMMVGEPMARAVWEHVRRFMENNGPALSPGDQPAPPPPKNAWQAANALFNGPGWLFVAALAIWIAPATYWEIMLMNNIEHMVEWHDKTLLASPVKAFLAIPVWFLSAWVFFAVVAHFTSPHVALPDETLKGAGQKLDLKAIAAQNVTVTG